MGVDSPFLLALAASSLLPRKEKDEANEKKREAHWDMLFIRRGQDIGEEVLTYFRNRTSRSKNSNGHSRIGWIMSANGLVFHPILENSSTTAELKKAKAKLRPARLLIVMSAELKYGQGERFCGVGQGRKTNYWKGLYDMIRLGGRYTISEDGEVQQCGPLTIYCAGPSHVVYGGQVIGRLVAAEAVKVVVGSAPYNPSEDE
ncbi:hypothetical protein CQW23_30187 [Capsicum baccatum]|uniref:AT-hook motif nuclear-localized protein n=1 Tax=Capsicum baccatum TaxID=33114 RepID=A0A2G2VB58_CAPBA|nr:hypothetical protein CQW23_30187 [Capsicum baccatum]